MIIYPPPSSGAREGKKISCYEALYGGTGLNVESDTG